MASELEIMNMALANIGEESQISDPETDTPGRQLRVIRALLPMTRDTILRSHAWLCCLRRRTLVKLTAIGGSEWKFTSAFRLPVDTLRVWHVDTCAEWERGKAMEVGPGGEEIAVRDVIWSSGEVPLRAALAERVPYEELDATVANAIAWDLSAKIAGPLQADKAMQKLAREEARDALAHAVMSETSEFGNQEPEIWSRWIAAR